MSEALDLLTMQLASPHAEFSGKPKLALDVGKFINFNFNEFLGKFNEI